MNIKPLNIELRSQIVDEWLLSSETVERACLRSCSIKDALYIAIPNNFDEKGSVVCWKLRENSDKKSYKGSKWRFHPTEKKSPIFGMHLWPTEVERVFWCEGERDCLQLTQHGYAAITSTTGVKSAHDDCLEKIPQNAELVLALDNDVAGKEQTKRITKKAHKERPDIVLFTIEWPTDFSKDITDFARVCRKKKQDFAIELNKIIKPCGVSVPPSDYTSNNDASRTQTTKGSLDLNSLPPASIDDVLERTRKLGMLYDYVVEAVLAVFISKDVERSNPLWLMLVGSPSCNKTQILKLLWESPDTVAIDSLTTTPFISGAPGSQDLLPTLDGKYYCVKDYTPFFGRKEEVVKQLLSDLVAIYDGEFSKHSPTRGTISYEASFSHVGGVTPQGLHKRQQYMNMVGARFLYLRVPELSEQEKQECFKIAWKKNQSSLFEDAARHAMGLVHSICKTLQEEGLRLDDEEESIKEQINLMAMLVGRARGIVLSRSSSFNNADGDKVTFTELEDVQVEEPFRALHQLKTLCRSLAVIRGKESVTQEELDVALKVALSSMPVHRAETLQLFREADSLTGKEAAERIETRSQKTLKRHLDELSFLGILKRRKDGATENAPWIYSVREQFVPLLSPESDSTLPF